MYYFLAPGSSFDKIFIQSVCCFACETYPIGNAEAAARFNSRECIVLDVFLNWHYDVFLNWHYSAVSFFTSLC